MVNLVVVVVVVRRCDYCIEIHAIPPLKRITRDVCTSLHALKVSVCDIKIPWSQSSNGANGIDTHTPSFPPPPRLRNESEKNVY